MTDPRRILPGIPLVESPLFELSLPAMELSVEEERIARELHRNGFAVFDFPDPEIEIRVDRIKADLGPLYSINVGDPEAIKSTGDQRVQDAWKFQRDVRALAANEHVLNLLTRLYGRRAFPFQTLNFPVGTQQALHSDSAHFSSLPERFMCGVWVAMEDISPDAGPLAYCPGSHAWPIITNAMIGRRGWKGSLHSAQEPFEAAWSAQIEARQGMTETLLIRKGQALIWAANLLHGGSFQKNPRLTRWSQVTHYYFDDCIYYTPAFSDEALGLLDLRVITDIATGSIVPNQLLGQAVTQNERSPARRGKVSFKKMFLGKPTPDGLPADWDANAYLSLNLDVASAGVDPVTHYLNHGKAEGRRYLR